MTGVRMRANDASLNTEEGGVQRVGTKKGMGVSVLVRVASLSRLTRLCYVVCCL